MHFECAESALYQTLERIFRFSKCQDVGEKSHTVPVGGSMFPIHRFYRHAGIPQGQAIGESERRPSLDAYCHPTGGETLLTV